MNHEYIGYGVRTDNVKWKEDIYSLLYEMIGGTHSSLNKMIEEEFKENGEGFSSPKTFFKNSCQNYEKHSMKSGWEMVLSDFINEQEFPNGKEYFIHENWVLHVPLFIPKDEEEKQVLNEEEEPKESEEVEEIVEDINEESEVEKLTKQLDKLKNDYARAYADTENLKKRLTAEAEMTRKYRIQSFAK